MEFVLTRISSQPASKLGCCAAKAEVTRIHQRWQELAARWASSKRRLETLLTFNYASPPRLPTLPALDALMKLDLPVLQSWSWEDACVIGGQVDAPRFKDYILSLILRFNGE